MYDATSLLYVCSLSDTTVVDSVKDLGFPVIGDVRQLDITILHHSTNQQYLIRIKQNSERFKETSFEVLEVLAKPDKPYVFDCLNLERYIHFNSYGASVHAIICACKYATQALSVWEVYGDYRINSESCDMKLIDHMVIVDYAVVPKCPCLTSIATHPALQRSSRCAHTMRR